MTAPKLDSELAGVVRSVEKALDDRRALAAALDENVRAHPALEAAIEAAKREYGHAEAAAAVGGGPAAEAAKARKRLDAARMELEALDVRIAAFRERLQDAGELEALNGRLEGAAGDYGVRLHGSWSEELYEVLGALRPLILRARLLETTFGVCGQSAHVLASAFQQLTSGVSGDAEQLKLNLNVEAPPDPLQAELEPCRRAWLDLAQAIDEARAAGRRRGA